jgi:hypothetical protein
MARVRVVVTRIEPGGAMHCRMVETAWQRDPANWDDLAARALAARPPYRPVPGTAVYHLCVGGDIIEVGEYDLARPLRDPGHRGAGHRRRDVRRTWRAACVTGGARIPQAGGPRAPHDLEQVRDDPRRRRWR